MVVTKNRQLVVFRENNYCLFRSVFIVIRYSVYLWKKQPPELLYKKGFIKNFANFTGKRCAGVSVLIRL